MLKGVYIVMAVMIVRVIVIIKIMIMLATTKTIAITITTLTTTTAALLTTTSVRTTTMITLFIITIVILSTWPCRNQRSLWFTIFFFTVYSNEYKLLEGEGNIISSRRKSYEKNVLDKKGKACLSLLYNSYCYYGWCFSSLNMHLMAYKMIKMLAF